MHKGLGLIILVVQVGASVFFFHFCNIASGATTKVQLVLLWLVARCCRSSMWPQQQILYKNLAATSIYCLNYLTFFKIAE